MQAINCIFCTKSNVTTEIKENGYEGKKCRECNLIFISPRPSASEIANLYGHNEAYIPAQAHIEQSRIKQLHARYTLKIIKKYIKAGDILEIGAGAGYFLTEAQKCGFNPFGLELNPIQADFIRSQGIACLETPLSSDSYGTQMFDVIYHADVLSHFYDPIDALKVINSKLKPGGYMIFETGNIADIHPTYYKIFTRFQYPDHLFFFGQKSITTLLDTTNFAHLKTYSYTITPQLHIMNYIQRYKKTRHTSSIESADGEFGKTIPPQNQDKKHPLISYTYHSIMHLIRYHLGRYLPQKNTPQTLIVIARKR